MGLANHNRNNQSRCTLLMIISVGLLSSCINPFSDKTESRLDGGTLSHEHGGGLDSHPQHHEHNGDLKDHSHHLKPDSKPDSHPQRHEHNEDLKDDSHHLKPDSKPDSHPQHHEQNGDVKDHSHHLKPDNGPGGHDHKGSGEPTIKTPKIEPKLEWVGRMKLREQIRSFAKKAAPNDEEFIESFVREVMKLSDKELIELTKNLEKVKSPSRTCPVTKEDLGGMGPPIAIEIKGETVLVCCSGCVDELLKNPDKYLTKPNSKEEKKKNDTIPQKEQENCPVTGEKLGSMGEPVPVEVNGKTIYVCCKGCVDAVKKRPQDYIKKVEKGLSDSHAQ